MFRFNKIYFLWAYYDRLLLISFVFLVEVSRKYISVNMNNIL